MLIRQLILAVCAAALVGPAFAQEPQPLSVYPIAPCRLIDSRQYGWALGDGETSRYAWVTGNCGVPAETKAIFATVTAINPTGRGHLIVYALGTPRPLVSSVSFNPGLTSGALVLTKLSDFGGGLRIYARVTDGGRVDWTIDVTAYLN